MDCPNRTVLVVDDDPSFVQMVKTILELVEEGYVVQVAHNGQEALNLAMESLPDIILRGRIVPVVDLRRRFGLEPAPPSSDSRIVVMEIRGQTVGMIVDGVSEVLQVLGSTVEPPSPVIVTAASSHLRGIARLDDRLISLLDLAQVLSFHSLKAGVDAN